MNEFRRFWVTLGLLAGVAIGAVVMGMVAQARAADYVCTQNTWGAGDYCSSVTVTVTKPEQTLVTSRQPSTSAPKVKKQKVDRASGVYTKVKVHVLPGPKPSPFTLATNVKPPTKTIDPTPKTQGKQMFTLAHFTALFAILGAVVFTYYAARHGVPWVWNKVLGFGTAAKADVAILKGQLTRAQTEIDILWQRMHVVSTAVTTLQSPPAATTTGPSGSTGGASSV